MMINLQNIVNLYFIGIGGIGMSALARYANATGHHVAGYDLTCTSLTRKLEQEGIDIHYEDNPDLIPASFNSQNTLVVITPAIPSDHTELNRLQNLGFRIVKRSELLGFLTSEKTCVAIAGTHGKTSVSTMTTLLLLESGFDTGAFLGGISRNFNSNLVLPKRQGDLVVTEADEFDRSFLQLSPNVAIITSMDADHLDIYGHHAAVTEAFIQFSAKIKPQGILILKKGLPVELFNRPDCQLLTYSIQEEADFCAREITIIDNAYQFDLVTPMGTIPQVRLAYPGRVNLENIVAASAASIMLGASPSAIKAAILKYMGVERRFDIRYRKGQIVYIDDYAHHPEELKATILSVRELYAGRKVVGIFQPHLYTRTRDFSDGFAQSLDLLDETILLDIYPARELPLPGVSSEIILNQMNSQHKHQASINDLPELLETISFDILLTLGAGNIDTLVPKITTWLIRKFGNEA